jgi:hypothetical protein
LGAFKKSVEFSIQKEFPDKEYLTTENNLSKSPSSLHSSSVSAQTDEGIDDRYIAEAEGGFESTPKRKEMPVSPHRAQGDAKFKAMSSVNTTDIATLRITTVPFPSSIDADKFPVPEQVVLLSELAKLLVRWALYASMNVKSVGKSPVKDKVSEHAFVSESHVQKLHMRPLLAMCTKLGATMHDARSSPRLYLKTDKFTLSGMLDIIFCMNGKVLGGGEFKVAFKSKSYIGQVYSSTLALAAGVNSIKDWDLDELCSSSKAIYQPFNIITNGEHTMRFIPSVDKRQMQADSDSSSDGSQSLQRIYNILVQTINDINTLGIGVLALASGDDDELGEGADEGGGSDDSGGGNAQSTGDELETDDVDYGDSSIGKGEASRFAGKIGPLEPLSLNMLNLMEHNIRMDSVAFPRRWNAT